MSMRRSAVLSLEVLGLASHVSLLDCDGTRALKFGLRGCHGYYRNLSPKQISILGNHDLGKM